LLEEQHPGASSSTTVLDKPDVIGSVIQNTGSGSVTTFLLLLLIILVIYYGEKNKTGEMERKYGRIIDQIAEERGLS
jgi:hypothetical protein